MTDLYETLGLDRDAQPDEIKRAYRKAAARTHPDAGGNADAFADVNRAYMVLYDPAKRARYDALGDADTKPRNDLGPVVSIIVAAFDRAVMEAAQRGVENVDIVALARQSIRKDIAEGEMSNAGLREAVKRTKKVSHRLRFSGNGENFIGRALDDQIRRHEANITGNNERLALLRKAVEQMALYAYIVDAPMAAGWSVTGGAWSSNPYTGG